MTKLLGCLLFLFAAQASAASALAPATEEIRDLWKKNACLTCHAEDRKIIGPSFNAIRERYSASPSSNLAHSIMNGSKGKWGTIGMPPNTQTNNATAERLAVWFQGDAADQAGSVSSGSSNARSDAGAGGNNNRGGDSGRGNTAPRSGNTDGVSSRSNNAGVAQGVIPFPEECEMYDNRARVLDTRALAEERATSRQWKKSLGIMSNSGVQNIIENNKDNMARSHTLGKNHDPRHDASYLDMINEMECYLKHRRAGAKSASVVSQNNNSNNRQGEGGGSSVNSQKPKKTTLSPAARRALGRAAAALQCVKIEPWAVTGVEITNTCSKGTEDQGLNFFWCSVGGQGPNGKARECGGPQFAKWVNQNETSGGAIEHGVVPLRYFYSIPNVYGATQIKFFACKHPYSVTNIKWDAKRGMIADCQKCSKFWQDGKNSCAELWEDE